MADGLSIFVLGPLHLHFTQLKEKQMPLCGYNENMANGIDTFTGGLVIQTKKRTANEGVSIAEIPAIEMEEIDTLLTELNASPKKASLLGVMAIGQLIRFFYARLDEELKKDPQKSVDLIFADEVANLNRLLFAMEEDYYENLRPNLPRLEAIRKIKDFLEKEVV